MDCNFKKETSNYFEKIQQGVYTIADLLKKEFKNDEQFIKTMVKYIGKNHSSLNRRDLRILVKAIS